MVDPPEDEDLDHQKHEGAELRAPDEAAKKRGGLFHGIGGMFEPEDGGIGWAGGARMVLAPTR